VTSLFSRLQKLTKEANMPRPWRLYENRYGEHVIVTEAEYTVEGPNVPMSKDDQALTVEAVNSLPAVLNAIDLLCRLSEWDALAPPVQAPFGDGPYWKREIDAALEPFKEEA
jgi:hypothetical protein